MAIANPKEEREHLRIPISWKTRITRTNKQTLIARLDNISEGGGHVITDIQFKPGETLLLECHPMLQGQAYPIKLIAKVVHTHLLAKNQGIGAGFYFTKTNEHFQELIKTLEERSSVF